MVCLTKNIPWEQLSVGFFTFPWWDFQIRNGTYLCVAFYKYKWEENPHFRTKSIHKNEWKTPPNDTEMKANLCCNALVCLLPFHPPHCNASLNKTKGLNFFCQSCLAFLPPFFLCSSAEHNPSSFPYLHGWVEARVKQGFVFNDVADSWHDSLI